MGEYYNWVNVDKKEFICPGCFNYGNKFHESMHKDSIPLHALHSLLINEWKGDRVLWFGDECPVPEQSSNGVIKTLYEQSAEFGYPGDAFDMICESYRNVSGLFKEAEKFVREEIGLYLEEYRETGKLEHYNEYGDQSFWRGYTKKDTRSPREIELEKEVEELQEEVKILKKAAAFLANVKRE